MNSIEVFVLTGPFRALFQSTVLLELFYTYLATREIENVTLFQKDVGLPKVKAPEGTAMTEIM